MFSAASSFLRKRESSVVSVVAQVLVLLLYALPTFAQLDEALVDPTMPLDYAAPDGAGANPGSEAQVTFGQGLLGLFTSYKLSSVLIRAEDRIAIINGERLREGDRIGNATVASIASGRVLLDVDGEIETLELYDSSIKTLVKGDE